MGSELEFQLIFSLNWPNSFNSSSSGGSEESEDPSGVALADALPKLKEPPSFAVILHNDHYTTMEFVVEVLVKYFKKSATEAHQIMLKVHEQGKGVAGIYHSEIAETKAAQVNQYARAHGFPLLCSTEPI